MCRQTAQKVRSKGNPKIFPLLRTMRAGWRRQRSRLRHDQPPRALGTERALFLRRAFAAVLVGGSEDSAAACLSQDLVEEVCLLVGAG